MAATPPKPIKVSGNKGDVGWIGGRVQMKAERRQTPLKHRLKTNSPQIYAPKGSKTDSTAFLLLFCCFSCHPVYGDWFSHLSYTAYTVYVTNWGDTICFLCANDPTNWFFPPFRGRRRDEETFTQVPVFCFRGSSVPFTQDSHSGLQD